MNDKMVHIGTSHILITIKLFNKLYHERNVRGASDHLNDEELRLEILRIVKKGTKSETNPLPICENYYKLKVRQFVRTLLTEGIDSSLKDLNPRDAHRWITSLIV